MEQDRIQRRLLELDVDIVASHALTGAEAGAAQVACTYTGRLQELSCDALVLVTAPGSRRTGWWRSSRAAARRVGRRQRMQSVRAVGDAYCPGTIAAAVWDGRRYAEELDQQDDREVPFLREVVKLADQPAEASA